jgi:hypothetical protein
VRAFRSRIAVALSLFVLFALAGWWVARSLPQRLEIEFEQRLSASLRTSVSLEKFQVAPGSLVRVEALGLRAWPHPDGAGLEVQKISSSLDPLSLLAGRLRLRRVQIEGLRLRVAAMRDEPRGEPPIDQASRVEAETSQPDDLLNSVAILEATVREFLDAPTLAYLTQIKGAFVEFPDVESSAAAAFELREIHGMLIHSRFGRARELSLRGRLVADGRDLGIVDLSGRRDRRGAIRIAVATQSLELGAAVSSWFGQAPGAGLDGKLSGEFVYESRRVGNAHFEIDIVGRELRGTLPVPDVDADAPRRIDLPGIEASAILEITPKSAEIRSGRFASQQATLQMSASAARPLQSTSQADISLEVDNVDVSQLRRWIGWFPKIEPDKAEAIAAPLQSGRLVELQASGTAALADWQSFLAGRTRTLPDDFHVEAEFADTIVWIGDSRRIEGLRGRIHWSGSRLEILEASARLNGKPLPTLTLEIEGLPHLIAVNPATRPLRSGARQATESAAAPLPGLATLWESLRSMAGQEPSGSSTRIEIEFDFLDHPMFLWPIRDLTLALETHADGIHVEPFSGSWAGVPIRAEVDWIFLPEQKISARLTAHARSAGEVDTTPSVALELPEAHLAGTAPAGSWARGRFRAGPIEGDRWRQKSAAGHFEATADRIQFRELAVDLNPSGTLDGAGVLDLSQVGAVPFQLDFDLRRGDADATAILFGLPQGLIQGTADLEGHFQGAIHTSTPLVLGLTGSLKVAVADGIVRRKFAAPVAVVAQANEATAKLDSADVLRYRRIDTVLDFANGLLRTESLIVDGSNLGVFASGSIDLASETKEVDGRVALFLFRKLDRMLEKIPIVNLILLGTNDNLVASYYRVTGPWEKPEAKAILLPGSAGPASMVLQGVPMFVKRGFEAILSAVVPKAPAPTPSPKPGEEGP